MRYRELGGVGSFLMELSGCGSGDKEVVLLFVEVLFE